MAAELSQRSPLHQSENNHSWGIIPCMLKWTGTSYKDTHHGSVGSRHSWKSLKREDENCRKYRKEHCIFICVAASFHQKTPLLYSPQRMLVLLQTADHLQTEFQPHGLYTRLEIAALSRQISRSILPQWMLLLSITACRAMRFSKAKQTWMNNMNEQAEAGYIHSIWKCLLTYSLKYWKVESILFFVLASSQKS